MFNSKWKATIQCLPLILSASLCATNSAQASFIDTTSDGAKYTLSWTNLLNVYSFTYVADFTSYTGTAATNNDYAMAFSVASVPGNVDWAAGSISAAPGTDSHWSIYQNVVTSSKGCSASGAPSKDWCIGLNSALNDGPKIDTSTILTWQFSMSLTSGTPNFSGSSGNEWSNKFVTTDGTYNNSKSQWNFGNYQVSEPFANGGSPNPNPNPSPNPVPVPGSLVLISIGLLVLGARRKRVG